MEFLSEPQRLLRDAVHEFAMRELAPYAAKWGSRIQPAGCGGP